MKDNQSTSCHEENQTNNDGKHKKKHGKMMMLCCLIPIVLAISLPLLGFTESIGATFILLLCPLLHIGMMVVMMRNGNSGGCHGNRENKELEGQK
ncbi:DUF2933 domain-containing protein [Clostridium sp. D2Q-11]|uniref:DUF2933 domain-containing protein n=1 Tax=Anaeromonas frigoriresistens TaxID=2683708 RepID=A0A942V1F1_9FIRM|nr:DUF2933 domain-containing protein [Anaeromonas frigoriresistens]MBS4538247.1 DUF2933 domain-containing protein [Anaeromonas frigoriresistens]